MLFKELSTPAMKMTVSNPINNAATSNIFRIDFIISSSNADLHARRTRRRVRGLVGGIFVFILVLDCGGSTPLFLGPA